MNRTYLILLLAVVALSVSSCVSKKKFVEMQNGRLKAEELSRKLDTENKDKAARIKALIADFEAMKNELMESNAMKDQYIDSLKGEISNMLANLNKQTRSLEETSFNLDFEKQRLTNALEAKEKSIQSLQSQVDRLEDDLSAKDLQLEEKNFEINKLNDQAKILQGEITGGKASVENLETQLEKAKSDAAKLQQQLAEKDATITKLQNQVKLLKSEIGQ
ncbi:hypothetical protein [Maribellus sp. YY47]|uniref:hypothetical protein n=1 Tax=Maribellus sp. YY47 TaxID=2929486 RepID=UPI0020005D21|nr:hypothetical protein [Maribellus sp. YY47]MCK3685821.1 hypothetical protein [Maribellus sp. YY47]